MAADDRFFQAHEKALAVMKARERARKDARQFGTFPDTQEINRLAEDLLSYLLDKFHGRPSLSAETLLNPNMRWFGKAIIQLDPADFPPLMFHIAFSGPGPRFAAGAVPSWPAFRLRYPGYVILARPPRKREREAVI